MIGYKNIYFCMMLQHTLEWLPMVFGKTFFFPLRMKLLQILYPLPKQKLLVKLLYI